MKLCVLVNKIDVKFLYNKLDLYLYYLPIEEYRKQILKGNINTVVKGNACLCTRYAINVMSGRFLLGEEIIKQCVYCVDYEELFDIVL